MAGVGDVLRRLVRSRSPEEVESESHMGDVNRDAGMAGPPGHGDDWTTDPVDAVPPWRRRDRRLIEDARSAAAQAADGDPTSTATLARDLRRLADLHADAKLSDQELVSGIQARLRESR